MADFSHRVFLHSVGRVKKKRAISRDPQVGSLQRQVAFFSTGAFWCALVDPPFKESTDSGLLHSLRNDSFNGTFPSLK